MDRPASYDDEIIKIYPKLEAFYAGYFQTSRVDVDVIQESVVRAMELYTSYDPAMCKFDTWIIGILINVALSNFKYNKMRHTSEIPDYGPLVEPGFDNDMKFIEKEFNTLTPRQQLVLNLKADGIKNDEIVKIVKNNRHPDKKLSRACIKSYVYSAKQIFKQKLIKAGYPL